MLALNVCLTQIAYIAHGCTFTQKNNDSLIKEKQSKDNENPAETWHMNVFVQKMHSYLISHSACFHAVL